MLWNLERKSRIGSSLQAKRMVRVKPNQGSVKGKDVAFETLRVQWGAEVEGWVDNKVSIENAEVS